MILGGHCEPQGPEFDEHCPLRLLTFGEEADFCGPEPVKSASSSTSSSNQPPRFLVTLKVSFLVKYQAGNCNLHRTLGLQAPRTTNQIAERPLHMWGPRTSPPEDLCRRRPGERTLLRFRQTPPRRLHRRLPNGPTKSPALPAPSRHAAQEPPPGERSCPLGRPSFGRSRPTFVPAFGPSLIDSRPNFTISGVWPGSGHIWPILGQVWKIPSLADFWPILSDSGSNLAMLAACGRTRPKPGRTRPNRCDSGPSLADDGRIPATVDIAHCKLRATSDQDKRDSAGVGQTWLMFGPNLVDIHPQIWSTSAQRWPMSTKLFVEFAGALVGIGARLPKSLRLISADEVGQSWPTWANLWLVLLGNIMQTSIWPIGRWAQHRPKFGRFRPSLAMLVEFAPTWAEFGPTLVELTRIESTPGQDWANLAEVGRRTVEIWADFGQSGPTWAELSQIW